MSLVLEAAAEKKAEDAVAIDLKGLASFTDGFVICTGAQRRQTQAICDAVVERLKQAGERVGHVEGYERGEWILMDLSDLVVHVFTPETREFYGLERLWGDAPHVTLGARKRASRSAPRARARPPKRRERGERQARPAARRARAQRKG